MNRRLFIKMAGVGAVSISSVGYLMGNTFKDKQKLSSSFPLEELKSSLENYFMKYFSGELFDPNNPLPNGIILIADGFEIETVTGKNTIFDIADQVIERCKREGFDAISIKNGVIPKGMEVGMSGITLRTPEKVTMMGIKELVDYDAVVRFENAILINSLLPPNQWSSVEKFRVTHSFDNGKIFMDKKRRLIIKIISLIHEYKIKVQSIKPNLTFAPNQNISVAVSKDIALNFLLLSSLHICNNK